MKVLVKATFTFFKRNVNQELLDAGKASAEQEIEMPHIPDKFHYLKMAVGDKSLDFAFQTLAWNNITQQFELWVKAEAKTVDDRERLRQDSSWREVSIQE